jgi:hypothetical protein
MLQRILVVLILGGLAAMALASSGTVATGQAQRPTQELPTRHIPPKCYDGGIDAQGRVWLYLAPAGQGCP